MRRHSVDTVEPSVRVERGIERLQDGRHLSVEPLLIVTEGEGSAAPDASPRVEDESVVRASVLAERSQFERQCALSSSEFVHFSGFGDRPLAAPGRGMALRFAR